MFFNSIYGLKGILMRSIFDLDKCRIPRIAGLALLISKNHFGYIV